MENNINLAFTHLPEPFKSYNEKHGKAMYEGVLYKPEEEKKDSSDIIKSLTILHLAGNTKEFIEMLEANSQFLKKSGHMTIEDQSMIIEMIYDEIFRKEKVETKNIAKLFISLENFIKFNYNKLDLILDWRPCFNLLYAIFENPEVKMEMYSLSQKLPFYDLVEKVYLKMNKFFKQGSAEEIYKEVKPFLFQESPKFTSNFLLFSLLVPTKRFNTEEDEIMEWFPEIMDLWKSMPLSSYFRSIFIRILAQVTQNFPRLDYTPYINFVTYQFNIEIGNQNTGGYRNKNCERYFANFYVNTFKSSEHLQTEDQKEITQETSIDYISKMYSDYLHPNNKFKNKGKLVVFLKSLSKSLCHRVRAEKTKLDEDPDFRFKYLFLQQDDIKRFIQSAKPLIESAIQGDTYLRDLSSALKGFIILDCDEILSIFVLKNFRELDNLTSERFIPILNEVILGTLVNDQNTSEYKYEFLQNSIEYLLEQAQEMDTKKLKTILQIFDSIWAVFPVLSSTWGKEFVEKFSKNKDYTKYLRAMKKKRIQEYQFYKFYEKVEDYATEYFGLLKKIMNSGAPIKNETIRAFWNLLNAMRKDVYTPLIKDLVETADVDNASEVLSKSIGNIAVRDDGLSCELVEHYLNKLLSKEGDQYELTYHNYSITQFNLVILNVLVYQNRAAASKHFDKIFELMKTLYSEASQEREIRHLVNLAKHFTAPFAFFSIVYKGILSDEQLASEEYMKHLWENAGKLTCDKLNFEIISVDQDSIAFFSNALEKQILPWLQVKLEENVEKHQLKILSGILKSISVNLQALLPPRSYEASKDFVSYYYSHINLSQEVLDLLSYHEETIFCVCESLTQKVETSEGIQRDSEIINNIGEVYKLIVTRGKAPIKEITFKENKALFSEIEYPENKRLESTYVLEVGNLLKLLLNQAKSGYDENSTIFKKSLERLYQFERYYSLIPSIQKEVKTLKDPKFIQYFSEFENKHIFILDDLYKEVLKLIDEVKNQTEKTVVTRDHLIGLLILFDKLCNKDVLKRKEQILRILLLIYTGSSIEDKNIGAHIWNVSFRTINVADRWYTFDPKLTTDNEDFYHVSSVFAKMAKLKTELAAEIQSCRKEYFDHLQDQHTIAQGIIKNILTFTEKPEMGNLVQEDTRILGSIDIWLCYFYQDYEYLSLIQNYLVERMFLFAPQVRNKALTLSRKIVEYKIKLNDFEKVENTTESMHTDHIENFNRYLNFEQDKYYDDTQLGYHSSVSTYTSYNGDTPFLKNSEDNQNSDALHAKLLEAGNTFMKTLFDQILLELNSKEDIKITNDEMSENNRNKKIQRMIAALIQKSRDTSTDDAGVDQNNRKNIGRQIQDAHASMGGAKYYNVFYQMIKYYGLEVYTRNILPVIQEFFEKGFKTIEHPHVTKSFLVDILSAVILTCKYYYTGNEETYLTALDLVAQLFNDCEQLDNTNYFPQFLQIALNERDPRRFESFINPMIESFNHSSSIKARNAIAFTSHLCLAFKWRGIPYASQLIQKILDKDGLSSIPQEGQKVKPTLALINHKNWKITSKLFGRYIANIQKHLGGKAQDEAVGKIQEFLHLALDSVQEIENVEENIFLLNNCIVNIIEIFRALVKDYSLDSLPLEFITQILKLSFLCIEKSVQKDTLNQSTALVGDALNKLVVSQDSLPEIKEFLYQYSTSTNWRIRENILYLLEGVNSNLLKQGLHSLISIEDIIPYFQDESIYVVRMAKKCLMTALRLNQGISGEFIMKLLNKKAGISADKSEERSMDPAENPHITLSAMYSFGYKIPFSREEISLDDFLVSILYLSKLSRCSSSELKTDILDFISRFKSIHQQTVAYQPERFTEEQLQLIKEIFSVSSCLTLV
ncbi:unnamed protein product [Moneuplotes crassus]|uniref:NTF2 domain-containing protein n=1 Tax=Euplotes crassus TaxID=5936 RepID=A0AAD1Y3E2_EUPCR|nr:unnamed protein product [Moneuplotes crassus]